MTQADAIALVSGRPGVFRLNLTVGRERFEEVVGWAPAEHAHARAVRAWQPRTGG
jgi:hypothetical protein